MTKFKEGMYVRCPIDYEDSEHPRMFALGQIQEVDSDFELVKVEFYNLKSTSDLEMSVLYNHIPKKKQYLMSDITKCKILDNSKVILNDYTVGNILCENIVDENGYSSYYVENIKTGEVKSYNEKDMLVHFTRAKISPIVQMMNYELHNPFWYTRRIIPSESLHIINNFSYGFETLIGSRAYLMSHQIDTIVRAVCEDPCRFILADEVGLGKTIEACVIMEGLRKKKFKFKTLIIAPESLCRQWQNELDLKFWKESKIVYSLCEIGKQDIIIIPIEKINEFDCISLLKIHWDLCIVDEVHRLVKLEDEYDKIKNISREVENILLLSATPIQERKDEYLKLLTLLNPSKYEKMTNVEFNKLYKKSSKIRNIVSDIYKNLDDFDEDMAEEIDEDLEYISDILEDDIVETLRQQIDINSEKDALEKIKLILAYISENYQIERNIIRHRREEIKDKLAKRSLEVIDYDMAGSEVNYYERNTYEELLNYIESIQNSNNDNVSAEYIKILLSSMFSSPWALKQVITLRHKYINNSLLKDLEEINSNKILNIIEKIELFSNEDQILIDLIRINDLWCKAADEEFKNIHKFYDDPDLINGKLIRILDYIMDDYDTTKYVIFSSWSSTVEHMKQLLEAQFGVDAVAMFYSKMDEETLEENVFRFQQNPNCRFMICDELGGEGRNFQIADKIIHIDLPFSPIKLEQRIGRLDRIGRDINKEVESVVVVSNDSIENDLFELWNEGLNIFNESLSGMEIALEDIKEEITEGLNKNIRYGLKSLLNNIKINSAVMKESVAKERYYDMAKQLDRETQDKFDKIIDKFDRDGGQLLGQTMINWSVASGWHVESDYDTNNKDIIVFKPSNISIKSMKNTLFMLPDTKEALKRSKGNFNFIKGTFSRDIAVKKEWLVFFAPGEPIFDSIMKNCQEGFRGKSCAIKVNKSKYNWRGFILKWNITFNKKYLLDKGFNAVEASKAQGYLPIDQITTFVKISGDNIENENELLDLIKSGKVVHMGKRDNSSCFDNNLEVESLSNIQLFIKEHPKEKWYKVVKAAYNKGSQEAMKMALNMIDFKKIDSDFDRILNGKKASNIYFDNENLYIGQEEKLQEVLNAVREGIKKAKVELDSIVYAWMER